MGQSQSTDNATSQVEKDCEAASDGNNIPASDRPRKLQDEIDELDEKQYVDWKRWEGNEHAIIPHTDAAGDQYCIGDAYEGIKTKDQWKIAEYVRP